MCLGCQAIAEVFGGSIRNLNKVYHGVATPVTVTNTNEYIFKGLPETFKAGRYHSWVVNEEDLPAELLITSKEAEGQIMGLMHKEYDLHGVQFHPESVLTEHGKEMIRNWIEK